MSNLNFDATGVAPDNGPPRGEPLPRGDYPSIVVKTEVRENNKRTGQNLEYECVVVDGPHKDRHWWGRFTLTNSTSPKAQEIGQRQLSALCHAVGHLRVRDSSELHNRPFLASLDIEEQDGYPPKNVCTAWKALGAGPQGPAPSFAAAPAPAPAPAVRPAAAPAWSGGNAGIAPTPAAAPAWATGRSAQ